MPGRVRCGCLIEKMAEDVTSFVCLPDSRVASNGIFLSKAPIIKHLYVILFSSGYDGQLLLSFFEL